MLLLNTTAPSGALGETRTPDSGLADRRVAPTPRTHGKLGPCRASAAGWLHLDPIGRSELRSRIENRRFLKEMAALTGVAPASRGLKGRDPGLLDDKAEK